VLPCLSKNPKYTFYTIKSSLTLAYYAIYAFIWGTIAKRSSFYLQIAVMQRQCNQCKQQTFRCSNIAVSNLCWFFFVFIQRSRWSCFALHFDDKSRFPLLKMFGWLRIVPAYSRWFSIIPESPEVTNYFPYHFVLYNKEIFNSRSTMWLKNPFNYVWNENIKNLNNIRTMLYRPICYVYHPPFFSSKIPRLKSVIDLYKGSGLQRRLISVIHESIAFHFFKTFWW
jgi:hypothetical protein